MYGHPATRANVARLRDDFGYRIVEPDAGPLASGQSGRGRLAETGAIVDAVVAAVEGRPVRAPDPATGRRSSPRPTTPISKAATWSSRPAARPSRSTPSGSSAIARPGKMGVALAEAALDRGARVTLIVGHVSVPLPAGGRVAIVHAETTAEMGAAVRAALDDADALVMAAAVADFRPREVATDRSSLGRRA